MKKHYGILVYKSDVVLHNVITVWSITEPILIYCNKVFNVCGAITFKMRFPGTCHQTAIIFLLSWFKIQKIKYSEMKFRVFWIFRILNRSKHEYDFRRLWHQNFSNMTIWRRKPIHFPKILNLIRTISFNLNHAWF